MLRINSGNYCYTVSEQLCVVEICCSVCWGGGRGHRLCVRDYVLGIIDGTYVGMCEDTGTI